jgi:hypothetical protein
MTATLALPCPVAAAAPRRVHRQDLQGWARRSGARPFRARRGLLGECSLGPQSLSLLSSHCVSDPSPAPHPHPPSRHQVRRHLRPAGARAPRARRHRGPRGRGGGGRRAARRAAGAKRGQGRGPLGGRCSGFPASLRLLGQRPCDTQAPLRQSSALLAVRPAPLQHASCLALNFLTLAPSPTPTPFHPPPGARRRAAQRHQRCGGAPCLGVSE